MAIGAMFEAPGFTADTYDPVLAEVGEEPPPGCLYHIAGPIEGGLRVIEIWRSEDDQRRFQAERLDPAFDRAGVQRVTPRFFAVHNTLPLPEAMEAMTAGGGQAGG